ncbi:diacylglycerol kinase family protein [Enterococcus plantarum]|uniref:diacylglycerol kinase family protein n=1 Tax=Enterococcus plantarum TaxID=1077675 RepID=UPI00196A04E9|nr:diacylglycerol kinase family protein [Enterococcus plantarum]MBO0423550.1 diacylglycerol kinase family protein [Enterococcus plantarum]MBO0466548.1 diacylglycerol kinase family protein [Enterococcus plantarum]
MDSKDKRTQKNKHFIASLEFALQGIKTVFKEERNMRTHTVMGIVAIVIGIVFRLTTPEWLWLLLAIFLVLVMEIINTVFENVVDMVTDFHFHPIGKKIKDMAAGAVLLTTGFAVVVGILLFVPKIWQIIQDFL